MRTFDSPPEAILATTSALRPESATGDPLIVEQVGLVAVQHGALFVGPRSGANGTEGVVVRVPAGDYAVVTTVCDRGGRRELLAMSVILGSGEERSRNALPDGAYLHEPPGPLPLFGGRELAVSDASIRDDFHGTEFPWDGWMRDIVEPAIDEAGEHGRLAAHVPYPNRVEAIVCASAIAGDVALFASFDEQGRPVGLHLESLEPAERSDRPVASAASDAFADPFASGEAAPSASSSASPFASRDDEDDDEVSLPPHFSVIEPEPADAAAPRADAPRGLDETPVPDAQRAAPAPPEIEREVPTAAIAEPDPGAERLIADALAGMAAAERRDPATALPLLSAVTDALAEGVGERPAVRAGLAQHELSGAHLLDQLVDVYVHEARVDEAVNALRRGVGSPHLRPTPFEALHLRRRLGELLLRSGDARAAVDSLQRARVEAESLAQQGGDASEDAGLGRDYLAHINFDLADAYLQSGEAGTAAALAGEASLQFESLRLDRMAGRSSFLAASAFGVLDDEGSRQQAISEAERIFRRSNELDGLGTALGFLGEADAIRGEYEAALMKFGEARRVLTEAGELHNAAIAAANEAVCLDHLDRAGDAAQQRIAVQELERAAAEQAGDRAGR